MPWENMRGDADSDAPPGQRGRYLLVLGAPVIDDGPRHLHFSYRKPSSYRLRDFTAGREMASDEEFPLNSLWQMATERIPCKDELFHPVEDAAWWKQKLAELDTGLIA